MVLLVPRRWQQTPAPKPSTRGQKWGMSGGFRPSGSIMVPVPVSTVPAPRVTRYGPGACSRAGTGNRTTHSHSRENGCRDRGHRCGDNPKRGFSHGCTLAALVPWVPPSGRCGQRELLCVHFKSCICLGWTQPFALSFSFPIPFRLILKHTCESSWVGRAASTGKAGMRHPGVAEMERMGEERGDEGLVRNSPWGSKPHRERRCQDVRPFPSHKEGFLFEKITPAQRGSPRRGERPPGVSLTSAPSLLVCCPFPTKLHLPLINCRRKPLSQRKGCCPPRWIRAHPCAVDRVPGSSRCPQSLVPAPDQPPAAPYRSPFDLRFWRLLPLGLLSLPMQKTPPGPVTRMDSKPLDDFLKVNSTASPSFRLRKPSMWSLLWGGQRKRMGVSTEPGCPLGTREAPAQQTPPCGTRTARVPRAL